MRATGLGGVARRGCARPPGTRNNNQNQELRKWDVELQLLLLIADCSSAWQFQK
jgi:hypothetical protein